ncbi:MAG TPA: beta-ketoacyl-[acyl-carrier-protein] synthase family protein [Opitutaceae bacterium]|nr:beta-ketoacyl-[acyl-carrier-protein] synthase family protein [Opitutaceae bacterium]
MPSRRRVAVTGLGFITSIGNDRASVTASLRGLRSGIARKDFAGPDRPLAVSVAGTIREFEVDSPFWSKWKYPAAYRFTPNTLRSLAPHGLYALCAMEQAIADARLTPAQVSDEATMLFSSSAGSPMMMRHWLNTMHDTPDMRGSPMGVVTSISGTLNFNLGTHFKIRGGNCGFVSACASSSHALGYAHDEISLGRCERVLVVGAEDLNADSLMPFMSMKALSNCADPAKASRPFDRSRDGFVGSGGAAVVILESQDAAAARGAKPYAELLGWAQSSDGFNIAMPQPEGEGLARALRRALAACGLAPRDIGYVNAHATSTPQGDRAEAVALQEVFTKNGARPLVSSTKGLTGHPLSMAGAMEAAFCALAIRDEFVPGNANLDAPDEACAGLELPRATLSRAPGIVLSNSSGFGGSNVVLALGPWKS